ncbi:MAG: tRNA preQ1(34) S-adenosylmethionine ribosyltransferase-isomerase QueA [Nisaea sp.]|jgi:S-adenosylmethionine:tRNA ribosyltransferase-isomerase|nr:tRNA preQ1(34) S-adenosylmethionine ribosyltransferase-isomerase QueA [Nisaea sp.]OUX95990.1 MAG: tRNA preQ1(34) S-adenosylmethionine ribosyltransferase-isomerase QueA [Candidatus Endolissoclinum sp. TMED26]
MKVDLFDYVLPPALIADAPAQPRDSARMLDCTGASLADRGVKDLPAILRPGDLLVFNDTKVLPTRLTGKRGAARVEVTLHKSLGDGQWRAFARPGKRLRLHDEVIFDGGLSARVFGKHESGEVTLDFQCPETELRAALRQIGEMPLPPYIKRAQPQVSDQDDYQTVFARHEGAVAAPTAGLHFTPELLAALAAAGVETAAITLHVGAGTFLPVKTEDTENHEMHYEWGAVTPSTVTRIQRTRAAGGRIISAGTTALRILESAAKDGDLAAFEGETNLFITPGFRFNAVDMLLTNFHLPRSTLMMLVAAFHGRERIMASYAHAIAHAYRFYSYGDCCLLDRRDHV